MNSHFRYTHGYGAVISPVNASSGMGSPDFFVKDIPPVSTVGIDITRPQIYYGIMTDIMPWSTQHRGIRPSNRRQLVV